MEILTSLSLFCANLGSTVVGNGVGEGLLDLQLYLNCGKTYEDLCLPLGIDVAHTLLGYKQF